MESVVIFSVWFHLCSSSHAQPLASWRFVTGNLAPVTGMAYGNGTFVGVGGGYDYISHDGSNWSIYAHPTFLNQAGIAYGNGLFVCYGTNTQIQPYFICASKTD